MSSKRRTSQNHATSAIKLRLDPLSKILKVDSEKSKKLKKEAIVKQVSKIALSELLKSTPQRTLDVPDFRTFLSNKENVKVFREFLKTQYCHENIDFYLACEKYRQLDPNKSGPELYKFMANQIYNDYLSESARQPVNIDHQCLQRIKRHIKNPQPDLLCAAQAEIFNLMKEDCYPRFCKTCQLDKETARKILNERPVNLDNSRVSNNTTLSYGSQHQMNIRRPRRTPPPPPLPPKVEEPQVGLPAGFDDDNIINISSRSSVKNNKLYPYVGRVYNV